MPAFNPVRTDVAVSQLNNQAVEQPVAPADILKQTPATAKIGTMSTDQVTALLAQAGASTGQGYGDVSIEKGIGKFGFSPQLLQSMGFLKPGTVEQFINKPSGSGDYTAVLQSPGCWTGKGGAVSLETFLSNPSLQNSTQNSVMNQEFGNLKSLGAITGSESPNELSAMVQGAAKFGSLTMAQWTKGQAPADLTSSISALAKDAQFSVNLVDKIPNIGGSPQGAVDTINRETLDNAITNFFSSGNNPDAKKIPLPTVGPVVRQSPSTFETTLYSNTSNEDLIYTGEDIIVWDRVNEERIKRGLPSLTALGIPRPPDTPIITA